MSFQHDQAEINTFAVMGGVKRIGGGMRGGSALGPSFGHRNKRFKEHQKMVMGQIAEYQDRRRKIKDAAFGLFLAGVVIAIGSCA